MEEHSGEGPPGRLENLADSDSGLESRPWNPMEAWTLWADPDLSHCQVLESFSLLKIHTVRSLVHGALWLAWPKGVTQ